MTRPQYGSAHQAARRAALAAFRDGSLCWRCRRPMRVGQRLDLDHVRPVVMGGVSGPTALVHARCNRSAGASLGNRLRGKRRKHNHKQTDKRHRSLPKWLDKAAQVSVIRRKNGE